MENMKTKPYKHQAEELDISKDMEYRALFWEQGTGKTKTIIDTAEHLYHAGKADCLLVAAPNGVHRNWISDEIPAHLDDSVPRKCLIWFNATAGAKYTEKALNELIAFKGLAIFAITYDALKTKLGRRAIKKLLTKRKVLMVADESKALKTPGAKITKAIIPMGRYAKYRRECEGTPVTQGPFDIYAQIRFLKDTYWQKFGLQNFTVFKNHYGEFEQVNYGQGQGGKNRQWMEIVGYQRMDELKERIDAVSSRVLKKDVLDLPPKIYQRRYVELTVEQQQAYDQLKEEWQLEVTGVGQIDVNLAIVRMIRFQQIVSGFQQFNPDDLPPDLFQYSAQLERNAGDNVLQELSSNRINILLEEIQSTDDKCIVWARFTHDIEAILAALKKAEIEAVHYYGATTDLDRANAITLFQTKSDEVEIIEHGGLRTSRPTARVFVANAQSAGEGLTLHAATKVIYYSNTYKLSERLQSEDRAHRIGQEFPVTYVDLVSPNTIDEKIVKALRDKRDIASLVTGDKLEEWI